MWLDDTCLSNGRSWLQCLHHIHKFCFHNPQISLHAYWHFLQYTITSRVLALLAIYELQLSCRVSSTETIVMEATIFTHAYKLFKTSRVSYFHLKMKVITGLHRGTTPLPHIRLNVNGVMPFIGLPSLKLADLKSCWKRCSFKSTGHVLYHKSFIPPFQRSTQLLWCIITPPRSHLTT
jgi:hypothetical protein